MADRIGAIIAACVLAGCTAPPKPPTPPRVVTIVHTKVETRDVQMRLPDRLLTPPAMPAIPMAMTPKAMGVYLGKLTTAAEECRGELIGIRGRYGRPIRIRGTKRPDERGTANTLHDTR